MNNRNSETESHPQNRQIQREQSENDYEEIDAEKVLKFGSEQIVSLFIPVSICMIFVGVIAKNINYYKSTDQYLIYTPFHSKDADAATTVWESVANAMIFITFVAVMTVVLVLLYKYRCYKFIYGYLIVATVLILFVMFALLYFSIAVSLNIYVDYLSLIVFVWNFGVAGFLAIHWKGPLLLQQGFLIVVSAKLSLILLKFLPLWTTWVLLGVLAIWDLIAVLCPFGPLRMLVNIATERNEQLFPALIYSTAAGLMVSQKDAENNPENEELNNPNETVEAGVSNTQLVTIQGSSTSQNPNAINIENVEVEVIDSRNKVRRNIRDIQDEVIDRGDRGVKLGLGDFVFYSLLSGRATLDSDPTTVLACGAAILVGMFLTVLLLAALGRALPALPISMACGILFYFLTSLIIVPFTRALSLSRVFI